MSLTQYYVTWFAHSPLPMSCQIHYFRVNTHSYGKSSLLTDKSSILVGHLFSITMSTEGIAMLLPVRLRTFKRWKSCRDNWRHVSQYVNQEGNSFTVSQWNLFTLCCFDCEYIYICVCIESVNPSAAFFSLYSNWYCDTWEIPALGRDKAHTSRPKRYHHKNHLIKPPNQPTIMKDNIIYIYNHNNNNYYY